MNTKFTPQGQSRQASVTPYYTQHQRNGYLTAETVPSKSTFKPRKSESTDTFEMQTLANQRPTIDAFHELEQLVPNGNASRAMIAEMSSVFTDPDESTYASRIFHSS